MEYLTDVFMHIHIANASKLELQLGDDRYCIRLNAQKRRSFRLHITTQYDLELLMPKLNASSLKHFLNTHQHWLEKQLRLCLERLEELSQVYQFQGQRYAIVRADITRIREQADALVVPQSWDDRQIRLNITEYKRQCAYELANVRLQHWWPKFSYTTELPRLRIKQMHTRWGSLSSKHNLNLSLELFSYPLEQIDLVLVHELCHIQHMNHSRAFYSLMQSILPDWQQREVGLKQSLMAI